MPIQIINVSSPDDGLGDKLRNSWVKGNANFSFLDTTKANIAGQTFTGDISVPNLIVTTEVKIGTTSDYGGVLNVNGLIVGTALIQATGFKTALGTALQFLKADGSIDSTVYQSLIGYTTANDANVIHTSGNEIRTGSLTSDSFKIPLGTAAQFLKANGTIDLTVYYPASNPAGYSTTLGTVTSVAALTLTTSGTDVTSSIANPTTTPVITLNIPTSSASNRGLLSSADWTIFNGKQNNLGFTPANSTISINTTAPLTGGGTLAATRTIGIPLATSLVDGYLSSSDWIIFNNKQVALVSGGNIKTINSVSLLGAGNIAVEPVITIGTASQYWRGDKTFQLLDKIAVGLANVDNTSDASKPVSAATQTALNLKVNKAGDTMTGDLTGTKFIVTGGDSTQWNTAYTDRNKWDGGSSGLVAATGRTSLGMTAIGSGLVTYAGVNQPMIPIANSSNLTSWIDYATFISSAGIQPVLTNPVTGTGTISKLPKWSATTGLVDSNISDNGTFVTVATDMNVNGLILGRGTGNLASNTVFGVSASVANTTGSGCVVIGNSALGSNTTGSNSIAIGYFAGKSILAGTNLTIANNSIFIGEDTRAAADNQTNQIVIGHQAIGAGSNTIVIGNSSITTSKIYGALTATSFATTTGSANEFLKSNGTVDTRTFQEINYASGTLTITQATIMTVPLNGRNSFDLDIIAVNGANISILKINILTDGSSVGLTSVMNSYNMGTVIGISTANSISGGNLIIKANISSGTASFKTTIKGI